MNLVGLNRGGEDILGRTARAKVWSWEKTWHASGDSVETDLVPPPMHLWMWCQQTRVQILPLPLMDQVVKGKRFH